MNEQTTPATLAQLAGGTKYTVKLKALTDGHIEEFPLAAPEPQDYIDAKDFIVKDRTKKAAIDTEGLLDPETRAKVIAEMRLRTQSHISVLLDQDGIQYMLFLMARRAGFSENWDGFRKSLQGSDMVKLQDALFALGGYKEQTKGASPLDRGTIAP